MATKDAEIRLIATQQFGWAQNVLGNYQGSIANLRKIVDGPEQDLAKRRFGNHLPPYILATVWLSFGCAQVGEFERAFDYADRCVKESESASPLVKAVAHAFQAMALACWGDFNRARENAKTAVELCETRGVLAWLSTSYSVLGWALCHSTSPSEGLPYLERAVTVHEATGINAYLTWMYRHWAEGLFLGGEEGTATEKAQHALSLARKFGE